MPEASPYSCMSEEAGDYQSEGSCVWLLICKFASPWPELVSELGTAVLEWARGFLSRHDQRAGGGGCKSVCPMKWGHRTWTWRRVKKQWEEAKGLVWCSAHEGTQWKPLEECSIGFRKIPRWVGLHQVPLSGARLAAGTKFIPSEWGV